MHFGIITTSGNVLEWFDDEDAAQGALVEMVREYPGAAKDLALLRFDDEGRPVGQAIELVINVVVEDSPWVRGYTGAHGDGAPSAGLEPVPA
jgi:hypothetical protein